MAGDITSKNVSGTHTSTHTGGIITGNWPRVLLRTQKSCSIQFMKASVIITTYNTPTYLAMVLESLISQTHRNFEVVVCDDGSSDDTHEVIARFRKRDKPFELLHYWNEDSGFRPGQARNGGMKAASGDWFVFIDGDILTHPRFIESHLKAARPNRVLFGARVKLNEVFSGELTEDLIRERGIERIYKEAFSRCREAEYSPVNEKWTDALNGKIMQRYGATWSPFAAMAWTGFCAVLPRPLKWKTAFKTGSNFSADAQLVKRVNGFDEAFGIGGGEDGEFFMRLSNAGAVAWPVLFSAVAYHLNHPDNWEHAGEQRDKALAIERKTIESGKVRCENGLAEHDYGLIK